MAKEINMKESKSKEKRQAELLMKGIDMIKQGIKVTMLMGSCANMGSEFILSAMIMVNADFLDSYKVSAKMDKKEAERLKKTYFDEISNLLDKYEADRRKEGN